MLRALSVSVFLACCVGMWAQQQGSSSGQNPSSSQNSASHSQPSSPTQSSSSSASPPADAKSTTKPAPDLTPPRSDRVNAGDLGNDIGESSSKSTQIDLSPPENEARSHPQSSEALSDAEAEASGGSTVGEFHPWDPHRAAKNIEVGDFYFKRKNYRAAEDRYREALFYKNNDAIATYRLGVCLEKMDQPDEARARYENYLKILPHGPEAVEAQKAIDRLKGSSVNAKKVK